MTYKHAVGSFNTSGREIATGRDTQAQGTIMIAREMCSRFQRCDKRYDSLIDESKLCALRRNIFNFLNLKDYMSSSS